MTPSYLSQSIDLQSKYSVKFYGIQNLANIQQGNAISLYPIAEDRKRTG